MQRPALTLGPYTHNESEDDGKFAGRLGEILRPTAPKSKEEGVAPGGQPLVHERIKWSQCTSCHLASARIGIFSPVRWRPDRDLLPANDEPFLLSRRSTAADGQLQRDYQILPHSLLAKPIRPCGAAQVIPDGSAGCKEKTDVCRRALPD